MPSKVIEYNDVREEIPLGELKGDGSVIVTNGGLMLLEIQGELNLPTEVPDQHDESMYIKDDLSVPSESHDAVRFGKLELDGKKATLFIGSSQRLVGAVEKVDPPLGVMRISQEDRKQPVEILDIIRQKVIFKSRPLPIM